MGYIWPCRWGDFQHYRPERDRAPAWLKDYTKQDDDDDYRELTFALRGLLATTRRQFAKSHGRLRDDPAALTRRYGQRVRREHIEALVHAGFIEIVSRETLEQRLELLYSSPRVRVEGEGEVDRETPYPLSRKPRKSSARKRAETWIRNGLAKEIPDSQLAYVIEDEFGIHDRDLIRELVEQAAQH